LESTFTSSLQSPQVAGKSEQLHEGHEEAEAKETAVGRAATVAEAALTATTAAA